MSIEGKINRLRGKEKDLLRKEYEKIEEALNDIFRQIEKISEKEFLAPNRNTLLTPIFSKITNAIKTAEQESIIGKEFRTLGQKMLELRNRLNLFKRELLANRIQTQSEAKATFTKSVISYLIGEIKPEFETALGEGQIAA